MTKKNYIVKVNEKFVLDKNSQKMINELFDIYKLNCLHEKGLLTTKEYEEIKEKLEKKQNV